jgi:hypothetical protein
MTPQLSELEVGLLRKLVHGEAVSLGSRQRLRLELAGAIRDTAQGITVTAVGKHLARQKPAQANSNNSTQRAAVAKDARGRRLPFQRRSIF